MTYVQHRFFCLNCGKENIPIYRKQCRKREKFHRKKLYCPWCKCDCNAIEVCSDQEQQDFLKAFNEHKFDEEAKESLKFCGQKLFI